MRRWNKISLFKFQQIDEITNKKDMSDIDKSLFATCVVFDMTEYQLDHTNPRKAAKLLNRVVKIFSEEIKEKPHKKIGIWEINYNLETILFSQFIELAYYASQNPLRVAHLIFATLASPDADTHGERADYFLKQPVSKFIGSLKLFLERFKAFNKKYEGFFGAPTENAQSVQSDPFQKRYGWFFSATRIADHNRFTLAEAMQLPVIEAFSDLAYLAAKDKFDEQQYKKK